MTLRRYTPCPSASAVNGDQTWTIQMMKSVNVDGEVVRGLWWRTGYGTDDDRRVPLAWCVLWGLGDDKEGPREYLLDVAVDSEFGVFFFNNSPKWNAFSMSKSRWCQS